MNGNVAHASGGGIYQSGVNLFLVNSTITRNSADTTGGGVQSSVAGGEVTLNSVTVARNVANASGRSALGGGLSAKAGSFGVVNSIVALNQAGSRPNDCHGTFDSFGGNLLSTMAGCRGFAGSALIAPDPKLGGLRDNGGPTKTLALLRGSPAIGKANLEREPAVDQRDRPAHRPAGHRRLRALPVSVQTIVETRLARACVADTLGRVEGGQKVTDDLGVRGSRRGGGAPGGPGDFGRQGEVLRQAGHQDGPRQDRWHPSSRHHRRPGRKEQDHRERWRRRDLRGPRERPDHARQASELAIVGRFRAS